MFSHFLLINKIALSSNDDKRMLWIDSIETYAYRMRKDLVSGKEDTKFNNIIKRYKNWLTLMMLQKKKYNVIQVGHKFLIIHTKC